jgi:hypothetical protein
MIKFLLTGSCVIKNPYGGFLMELNNSMEIDFEDTNLPQNIQFEVVEDELLAINRPTVQVYEQA